MPQKERYNKEKRTVALLEQQLLQLQLQHSQLQESRHTLLLQACVAQDWCDTLLVMLRRMTQLQGSSVDPGLLEALSEQAALAAQEASSPFLHPAADPGPVSPRSLYEATAGPAALAPARGTPPSGAHAGEGGPAGAAVSSTVTPMSPLSAPSTHFRALMAREPIPGAQALTPLQVAEVYREAALQSGVLLMQLPRRTGQQRRDTLRTLGELWDRYSHTYLSVFLMGRWRFMEEIHTKNLVNMQPDAEGSEAAAADIHKLLPELGLTPQQEEMITTAYALFLRHHERITAQRAQLQRQVAATDSAACCVPGDGGGSSDGSDCGNSESLLVLSGRCDSRRVELDQQQQTVQALQKLLHKEMILRLVAPIGIAGCLSHEQMARLAVHMWPYHFRVVWFAKAVYQQQQPEPEQQEQQQQEQQQQEQERAAPAARAAAKR